MDLVTTALCKQADTLFESMMTTLEAIQQIPNALLAEAAAFVDSMVWSPQGDVVHALKGVLDNMDQMVPDVSEYDEIAGLMNKCNFFSDTVFDMPSALVGSLADMLDGMAMDFIDWLTEDIPEVALGKLLNGIELSYKADGGISSQIKISNKALSCLSAVCGMDVSAKQARLNALTSSLYVTATGLLDINSFMVSCGVSDPTSISLIEFANDTLNQVEENIDQSIQAGINVVNQFF